MGSLHIEYSYTGDEDTWTAAINEFITNFESDPKLCGKFRYSVFTKEDGKSRVHIPSWDTEETLSYLQAQSFFVEFSTKVKEFAGDSLKVTKPTICNAK